MPNQKIDANDGPVEKAQAPDRKFISDERRLQDAREDDEVRENLRAFHRRQLLESQP